MCKETWTWFLIWWAHLYFLVHWNLMWIVLLIKTRWQWIKSKMNIDKSGTNDKLHETKNWKKKIVYKRIGVHRTTVMLIENVQQQIYRFSVYLWQWLLFQCSRFALTPFKFCQPINDFVRAMNYDRYTRSSACAWF